MIIEIPAEAIPVGLALAAVVAVLLAWSVLVNNRRWKLLARDIGGELSIYSGLALRRVIHASIDGYPFEVQEATALRNTLPGTAVKLYLPLGFHLRVWPKGHLVFYKQLKRITPGGLLDEKFDVFRKFEFYTDNPERAATLLNDRTKRYMMNEFASRGGFEITPNYMQCLLRDKSLPEDPLQKHDGLETQRRVLTVLRLMVSLAHGRDRG
jgi:hypothetical protein